MILHICFPTNLLLSISLNRMRPQLWNSAAVAQSKISDKSSWLLAKGPERLSLWAEECGEKLHYVSFFPSPCPAHGPSQSSNFSPAASVWESKTPRERKRKCPEELRKCALCIKSVNESCYFYLFLLLPLFPQDYHSHKDLYDRSGG